MKRARTSGGSLTGGTGDVKPQFLTLSTGTTAVNDYVVNQVSLPVPRFGTMKTKATIFEILSVDWFLGLGNLTDATTQEWGFLTTSTGRVDGETSTAVTMVEDLEDPKVFAPVIWATSQLTSGTFSMTWPIHVDLTDNNGNGILVATDRLFIVGANIAGAAADYVAKIKYRLVNVGITEYVGIVQSQQ